MAKTLVLIRHGKAVPRGTRRDDDALRLLTEGGVRSLRAKLPGALSLIGASDRESLQVWTSPALRASQTASIVAEVLGACDPIEHDCLWAQDIDRFLREFEECDASCVVAVGHNPFVDDAAARLAGVRLPFFTGAAIALRVEKGAALSPKPSARLLWFVQGPKASRFASVVALEETLARASDAVGSRLQAFLDNPDDPETMHKLRVSIRTMRSLLSFVAPWQKASQNKRMRNDLRTAVRWTSRLRELDVLVGQARALDPACEELVDAIAQMRDSERDRVAKKLAGKRGVRLIGGVHAQASSISWKERVVLDGISRGRIRARFEKLVESLTRDMEALDMNDAEATHDARKDAKRVRYSAEGFAEFLDADATAVAKRMTRMQDGLGAVCDARVNIAIIDSLPEKGLSDEAREALAALRASNESVLREALGAQGGGLDRTADGESLG